MNATPITEEIFTACRAPSTPRQLIIYSAHIRRKDLALAHRAPDTDASMLMLVEAMRGLYPDAATAHTAIAFLNRFTDNIAQDIHTEQRATRRYWWAFAVWACAILLMVLLTTATPRAHLPALAIAQTGWLVIVSPLLRIWSRGRKAELLIANTCVGIAILFAAWLLLRGVIG